MRKLTVLITLLTASFCLEAQGYLSFPDSGGVWRETYSWVQVPFFYYNGTGDTYIEGDTIFNTTNYKKVYNLRRDVYCYDVIISGPDYCGALREDTIERKVYYRGAIDTVEQLLYDYSLEIGDTLQTNLYNPNSNVYVSSIDTITTLDNTQRRCWHLENNDPSLEWPQIIEGIGSTSGLIGGIEPLFETWNELLCFFINDNEIWHNWRNNCYVFTDTCAYLGINESVQLKPGIKCYPNPASDIINFVLPDNEDYEIVVYDALSSIVILNPVEGRTIEDGKCSINISHLPPGIYFIEARGDKILRGRFVKE